MILNQKVNNDGTIKLLQKNENINSEINDIIDGACAVKSLSDNPVSNVICYGIEGAGIIVGAAVTGIKNLRPSLSKKTFETHFKL